MNSFRDICMLLTRHDIFVNSIWISTKNNVLVDILSRFQFDKIVDICSQLNYLRLKCETLSLIDIFISIWASLHLYFFDENSYSKLVKATTRRSKIIWNTRRYIIVVFFFDDNVTNRRLNYDFENSKRRENEKSAPGPQSSRWPETGPGASDLASAMPRAGREGQNQPIYRSLRPSLLVKLSMLKNWQHLCRHVTTRDMSCDRLIFFWCSRSTTRSR